MIKKALLALVIISVAALSFWAGGRYGEQRSAGNEPRGEPVQAGNAQDGQNGSLESYVPGAVTVSPDRQQLIGVKVAAVEKRPMSYTLRLYGRVVPEETKTYRINASTDCWIREISSITTGSIVQKNQVLAEALAPAYYNAQLNYVLSLDNVDRIRQQLGGEVRHQQNQMSDNQIRMAIQGMQNLGITDAQIEELAKTRKARPYLQIRAPARGVVLSRNVTLNQWFKAGDEFFRIADIGRVWVYADVYEGEAVHMKPGMAVAVRHGQMGKTFSAKVGKVLPLFDPAARTLKVRIDVDNPRYDLRPDMFVDVEIPITMPPSISVPADAVLDTGKKAIVYVDRGNGVFEPRRVKTGWNLGGQVEITAGLEPRERVVVSGNFLIDSESRMAIASSGAGAEKGEEPVGEKAVEKPDGPSGAGAMKDKPKAPAKARVPAKAKRETQAAAQPKPAVQGEGDDPEGESEEKPEGTYPFPGAQYLGTVPRDPAPAEGEPPKDKLPPTQFEIPAAPPSGTRLK
ncbi:MAG TPA: efflux RND transporter periplasmic adaptor subunit [Syntrophales bacterium]|nr:efflux RND transporter periplasmic adaptor subunit [Syntrophales bacterium]